MCKSLVLFGVGPGPVLCCLLSKRKSSWGFAGRLPLCRLVLLVRFTGSHDVINNCVTSKHSAGSAAFVAGRGPCCFSSLES